MEFVVQKLLIWKSAQLVKPMIYKTVTRKKYSFQATFLLGDNHAWLHTQLSKAYGVRRAKQNQPDRTLNLGWYIFKLKIYVDISDMLKGTLITTLSTKKIMPTSWSFSVYRRRIKDKPISGIYSKICALPSHATRLLYNNSTQDKDQRRTFALLCGIMLPWVPRLQFIRHVSVVNSSFLCVMD